MTHETTSPAAEHTGWRGILSFRPTAGWVAEHVREELELFATLAGESTFTPSVVVTVNPFTGSIREFSQRAQDGLAGTLDDLRMIDVGGWEPDPQPVDPDQPQGEVEDASSLRHRRLEYVHRAPNGRLVSGVDYLLLRDGWAIQVSTTCSIQERVTLSDAFHHMVDSVTTLRPADTSAPSDDATSAGDPPLDAAASAALGADVETLDRWAAQQPLPRDGAFVHVGTINAFAHLDPGGPFNLTRRIFRPKALTDEVLADCERLGLLSEGRPTDVGAFFHRATTGSQLSVRVTAFLGDQQEHWLQAAVHDDRALVIAQPGWSEHHGLTPWIAPDQDHRWVEIVPLVELSTRLLEWTGTAPSWNLLTRPPMLPSADVARRTAGESAPISDEANPAMERLCAEPWWHWQLQVEADGVSAPVLPILSAGRAGPHVIAGLGEDEAAPEYQVIHRTQGFVVLWQIEDRLQAVREHRDLILG